MKIIFMGTPEFSVATLEKIIEAGHDVAAVVTQPDKPKGRGKAVTCSPVKEKAMEKGIPVYQPAKVKTEEFVRVLRELDPDVIVVVAFGQILSKDILDMPKYGCINVHASLLPKYRGAAPIQWSIIDGEKETGITTMYMDVGLDTGDKILMESVTIEEKETAGSLHDKLAAVGAKLLVRTLEDLESGRAVRVKQTEEDTCYAKQLTKSMGRIDFTKSAEEIERLIRGLNPWPSAYTSLGDKTLKIWEADAITEADTGELKTGQIVLLKTKRILVQTGKGQLEIKELQLEGKKRMSAADFLRGFSLEAGTLLE